MLFIQCLVWAEFRFILSTLMREQLFHQSILNQSGLLFNTRPLVFFFLSFLYCVTLRENLALILDASLRLCSSHFYIFV